MAGSRTHIRTDKSMLREATAKQLVEKLLSIHGFEVVERRIVRNRYFIDVRDLKHNKRTFWFKLGWNPGNHGTSAVQIEMIKPQPGGLAPSKWSDAEVVKEVTEKIARGEQAGASDLLLFSLDRDNQRPIACLLVPINRVAPCFRACMKVDTGRSRNGASPVLWLRGSNAVTLQLQRIVESYSIENLLGVAAKDAFTIDDALEDLVPDASLIGSVSPKRRLDEVARYPRDPGVRDGARKRANGRCELCNEQGFLMENGNRYLETHHIQALGEEGPDTEDNVIALCADDHRAAHFSAEKSSLAERLKAILAAKLFAQRASHPSPRRSA